MDCKIDYSTKLKPKHARGGFGLPEYVVALAVSSLIMVVVTNLTLFCGQNFALLGNYADMQTTTMNVMNQMTKEMRQARRVLSFSPNQVTLEMPGNVPLTYTYSPGKRTLTRSQGAGSKVILQDCDDLTFKAYQRTPKKGSLDQNDIAATSEAKVVAIAWNCSRSDGAGRKNAEATQYTKVMLRAN
jgi:hypothetical protein